MALFGSGDPTAYDRMQQLIGPAQVDAQIRQAIQMCWMLLPESRRSVDELELQIRRVVDRAFQNIRDDEEQFRKAAPTP